MKELTAVGSEGSVARALTGSTETGLVDPRSYRIFLEYDLPFAERVRRGRYGYIGDRVVEARFSPPLYLVGTAHITLRLIKMADFATTREVEKFTEECRLTPGRIEHLLTFGDMHPEMQRFHAVIALGSSTPHHGKLEVPFLHLTEIGGVMRRSIDLVQKACVWDPDCYFLAVEN